MSLILPEHKGVSLRAGLPCGSICAGGSFSSISYNLSPRCSPGRERDGKGRAAPAFLPRLSQREGKTTRQREWVVCHTRLWSQGLCRAGETSMRTVALPNQQQEVCSVPGAVPFCLSQWGSVWAPITGLSQVQHLCLCVAGFTRTWYPEPAGLGHSWGQGWPSTHEKAGKKTSPGNSP